MPNEGYREFLLQRADDAAQRVRGAEDLAVRAAWQRIETSYRVMLASVDDAPTTQPIDQSAKLAGAEGAASPR